MTWEIALIVSSVVSAGTQAVKSVTEAHAGQLRAAIERGEARENADLATLEALTDEKKRREDFAIWDAEFLASQFYDGPSFLAKREDAIDTLDTELAMIQKTSSIKAKRFLTTANAKSVERKQLGVGKWLGVVDAGTTLFKGVYEAKHYKPGKEGIIDKVRKKIPEIQR